MLTYHSFTLILLFRAITYLEYGGLASGSVNFRASISASGLFIFDI